MSFKEIGVIIIVMIIIVIWGNIWFSIVEGVIGKIKNIFKSDKKDVWHSFSDNKKE